MSMGKMMVSEARLVKRLGLRPHVILHVIHEANYTWRVAA